ncbi:peptidoglycan-binding domain-containing protein [Enhydrobacter aerosaccus]|nr:peptidoglycan-binding protein [Enhydrobacter aerosaccus]
MTVGPEPGRAEPARNKAGDFTAGRRPPLQEQVDPEAEARFKKSIADLSRRLSERAAQQADVDPKAEVEARRRAARAYFSTRARRWKMVLGTAGAATAAACIAWLVVMIAAPPDSETADVAAAQPARPPIQTADLAPTPNSLPSPPSGSVAATPPVDPPASVAKRDPTPLTPPPAMPVAPPPVAPPPVSSAPVAPLPSPSPRDPSLSPLEPAVAVAPPPASVTATDSAPVATAPFDPSAQAPAPLRSEEVREAQGRLRSFGFNPGPVDGTPGPMTRAAIMHYQQERGLQQTGQLDRDLLDQLRRDPAPQLAVRPDPPPRPRYATRSADPFAPLQQIGDSITRWFQSIGR